MPRCLADHEPRHLCNPELEATAARLGVTVEKFENSNGSLPAGTLDISTYFERGYDTLYPLHVL